MNDDAIEAAQSVLAKCAANDPWFPQPSRSTALAWAEHFERWNLTRDELLAGVTKAYEDNGHGFKPLPKDIIEWARAIRRDRSDREDDEMRAAREAAIDAKAAGRQHAVLQFVQSYDRSDADA